MYIHNYLKCFGKILTVYIEFSIIWHITPVDRSGCIFSFRSNAQVVIIFRTYKFMGSYGWNNCRFIQPHQNVVGWTFIPVITFFSFCRINGAGALYCICIWIQQKKKEKRPTISMKIKKIYRGSLLGWNILRLIADAFWYSFFCRLIYWIFFMLNWWMDWDVWFSLICRMRNLDLMCSK